MSTKGGPVFIFTLPGGWAARPLAPVSYTTAGSANLYDIVANLPEGSPIYKSLGPRKSKFASGFVNYTKQCLHQKTSLVNMPYDVKFCLKFIITE